MDCVGVLCVRHIVTVPFELIVAHDTKEDELNKHRRAESKDFSEPVAFLSRPKRKLWTLFHFGCISILFVTSSRLGIGYFGYLQVDAVAFNLGEYTRRNFGSSVP